jgi:putative membrane protein
MAILALSFGIVLGACHPQSSPPATEDGGAAADIDARAAAIAEAANKGEIQLAQLAQERATNPDVKAFADRMVTEHTATLQRQQQLFSRVGLTPKDNDTAKSLRSEVSTMSDRLKNLSGTDFDREYIAGQVTLHTRVLSLLDNDILPKLQRDDVRADFQRMRSDIAAHLEAAKEVQKKL